MIGYRDFVTAFRRLEIDPGCPVIVHASLSAFGEVQGGAGAVLGALLSCFHTLVMPAFTYKTMLIPEAGPPDNGLVYGYGRDSNRMAEFYHPDMPADRSMGRLAEALRCHPQSRRSLHPILSFTGLGADLPLQAQTLAQPLAPIGELIQAGGWVLLLGVDHTVNTSIHYAEWRSGRKQFLRWALTRSGVVECPRWPGCSDSFNTIAPRLEGMLRRVKLGEAQIQAVPLDGLYKTARLMIEEQPLALLCNNPLCGRCQAVQSSLVSNVGRRPACPAKDGMNLVTTL